LRRTTSSTAGEAGCLSTTATGPIRIGDVRRRDAAPQAPCRETTTFEKPRDSPFSGAY
jgi:hypothetical protein